MKLSLHALKTVPKAVIRGAQAKSPEILAGLAIAGVVLVVVESIKAGPEVKEAIDEANEDLSDLEEHGELTKDAKRKVLLVAAKRIGFAIVPAFVAAFLTIACIAGSLYFNNKQKAVLVAAATVSENQLQEYKDKVKELFGERKATQVEDEITADQIRKRLEEDPTIIETGHGSDMFFDTFSGQFFRSNIDYIRRVACDLQTMIRDGDEPTVSDLQHGLGLYCTDIADDYVLRGIGRGSDQTFEFTFSSHPKPYEDGMYITAISYPYQLIKKDRYKGTEDYYSYR